MKNSEKTMEKIVALCKGRGFIFSGSEIYGGLANTWDYGPLGVELKNNVKKAWWKKFVQENPYNVGLDAAILMNPQTWVASGHLGGFSDPLMDCKECKERFRADKLIEDWAGENGVELEKPIDAFSQAEMKEFIESHNIPCPSCGKHNFTDIRQFNLMFKTFQGVTEDAKNTVYLRPETAQGIFVNFQNVQRTTRKKLPFGVCQIGKSFRNEITPGNFTFRTREFEQMELEFFCKPGTDLEWFQYWKDFCHKWLLDLNMTDENLRLRDHEKEEVAAKAAKAVNYRNAGTVEFLYKDGQFYFMEMNTRLQVEHTVTEMVTGLDLVKWQIRIAAGQKLGFSQEDIRLDGHAIECRINAENPEQNFRPSCGRITLLHIPGGPWVRFDTALYQDYFVPPYYDSMIGKLIVYAKTREEAIRKLQAALCELVIEGVDHNSQLHMELLSDSEFKSGDYYTDFMAKKGY